MSLLDPGVYVDMYMCSDSLNAAESNALIAALLHVEQEPQRACERLVAEAIANGGDDNIRVIVVCF